MSTHKLSSDRAASVAPEFKWLPINEHTPRGAKMLLINRAAGVAHIGLHSASDTFYSHWAPLPTFTKN
jgi:hypothetical protein